MLVLDISIFRTCDDVDVTHCSHKCESSALVPDILNLNLVTLTYLTEHVNKQSMNGVPEMMNTEWNA